MDDFGRIVEQAANAMAAKIAHYAKPLLFGMALNGMRNIAKVVAWLGLRDAEHQGFKGRFHQPLGF